MPAADGWLDRPMYVLNVGRRGFAPLTLRDDFGLAGLAFADRELAAAHRSRADRRAGPEARDHGGPRREGRSVTVLTLDAGDLRAREEWLGAVLAAGAARVGFDLSPSGGATPGDFELSAALLAEVLSYKRGLACF